VSNTLEFEDRDTAETAVPKGTPLGGTEVFEVRVRAERVHAAGTSFDAETYINELAAAFLAQLCDRYGVERAHRAYREAVRNRPAREPGRRRRAEEDTLDELLLARFDSARAEGQTYEQAVSTVVDQSSGENSAAVAALVGRALRPGRIERRLADLLAARKR
jgi:hypothetical protein